MGYTAVPATGHVSLDRIAGAPPASLSSRGSRFAGFSCLFFFLFFCALALYSRTTTKGDNHPRAHILRALARDVRVYRKVCG